MKDPHDNLTEVKGMDEELKYNMLWVFLTYFDRPYVHPDADPYWRMVVRAFDSDGIKRIQFTLTDPEQKDKLIRQGIARLKAVAELEDDPEREFLEQAISKLQSEEWTYRNEESHLRNFCNQRFVLRHES